MKNPIIQICISFFLTSSLLAQDHDSHAGHGAKTPQGPLKPLKTIMQDLETAVQQLSGGVFRSDFAAIAKAADAIAAHPQVLPDEMARISKTLGKDMAHFKHYDHMAHDAATKAAEAARHQKMEGVMKNLVRILDGCVGCHTRFRDPVRKALASRPSSAGQTALTDQQVADIAQPAVASLKKSLVGRLQEALKSGGPVGAIDVCKTEAMKITAGVATEKLQLGRTSSKVRNPANAPLDWMIPVLKHYAEYNGPGSARPWQVVRLQDGRYGYAEPLYVQSMCLVCHGGNLAPAVQAELARRYPSDQAVGYKEGQFRGLAWGIVTP